MPLPIPDGPAHRAGLAGVGRVHKQHSQTSRFGLIGDKSLKLPKGPAMQSRPNPLSGLDISQDVGQVFQADLPRGNAKRLGNNGLAYLMIDVANTPLLTPGDSLELALGSAATVGLEATAMGKVNLSPVANLSAVPDLARAGGGDSVLAHIDPEHAFT